jgi:hypothetical protein
LKGTILLLAALAGATGDDVSRELVAAAARGDSPRVAGLLREGADPNTRDASGRPALLVATASGRVEAVTALLRGGASPDRGDASGWTALHQAVEAGDSASARALLEAGATPDLRARSRGTPLDVAETTGRPELTRLLRARGARGSGKSIGDTVCVRPWSGDGYCARVLGRDATRFELRLTEVVGCSRGCAADAACSGGRGVGAGGLLPGDRLWVPASCLTHTGVEP